MKSNFGSPHKFLFLFCLIYILAFTYFIIFVPPSILKYNFIFNCLFLFFYFNYFLFHTNLFLLFNNDIFNCYHFLPSYFVNFFLLPYCKNMILCFIPLLLSYFYYNFLMHPTHFYYSIVVFKMTISKFVLLKKIKIHSFFELFNLIEWLK